MLDIFFQVILIPVWCSILILSGSFANITFRKKTTVILSCSAVLLPLLYSLYGLYYTYHYNTIETVFRFITINDLSFNLGIYVDMLNSLTGVVISIITLIVYIYSAFYMQEERKLSRYYSLLNLFYASIISYIFSPNLFQMLICWELTGVISYLLIGYWYQKDYVAIDSKRVFLINIIGDIALFLGFVIVSGLVIHFSGDISLASLPFLNMNIITSYTLGVSTKHMYTFISLLFVIAAMVKSAQFPINSWLIDAMSAPTPVSALIHSSTLVISGVFLLLRVFPIISSDITTVKIVLAVGFITAILASLAAIVQTNIKKILAYSTSAQLGLVFTAIGSLNPVAAIVYFLSHAFIKSLLFMCAGNAIKITDSKNIMFMGQLREYSPITAICFLIGATALTGIGFCGFNSKYLISSIFANTTSLFVLFGIVGILTAIYIFRVYYFIFERKASKDYSIPGLSKIKIAENCLILTSILIILGSFLIPSGRFCILYLLNILTIATIFYILKENIRLPRIRVLKTILYNGFYINKIYYLSEKYLYSWFTVIINFIDTYIIGGIEYLTKHFVLSLSKIEHKMQTNNIQSYISYSIWLFIMISITFTFMYLSVLNLFGV